MFCLVHARLHDYLLSVLVKYAIVQLRALDHRALRYAITDLYPYPESSLLPWVACTWTRHTLLVNIYGHSIRSTFVPPVTYARLRQVCIPRYRRSPDPNKEYVKLPRPSQSGGRLTKCGESPSSRSRSLSLSSRLSVFFSLLWKISGLLCES